MIKVYNNYYNDNSKNKFFISEVIKYILLDRHKFKIYVFFNYKVRFLCVTEFSSIVLNLYPFWKIVQFIIRC